MLFGCTASAPEKHVRNRSGEVIGRREERGSLRGDVTLIHIPYTLEESIEGGNKEDCDHFLHLLHERPSKQSKVTAIEEEPPLPHSREKRPIECARSTNETTG
ncbi:hypothetical protein R1flu_028457 [Riccia fluitans]|uniref:Uncharacterized protein n=1 Tax=Riccia fluitans TaxID=41844 RepID=A0ABD1XM73_9MARC